MNARNLESTFVVSDGDYQADTIDVTDSIWADIDDKYGDFAGRTLVSSFDFDETWPTWEMHPAGDEIVCLVSGEVDVVLALPGGDTTVRLDKPGDFAIVPKGIWHTAIPQTHTRMIFVTPGQGTENREQPVREPAD